MCMIVIKFLLISVTIQFSWSWEIEIKIALFLCKVVCNRFSFQKVSKRYKKFSWFTCYTPYVLWEPGLIQYTVYLGLAKQFVTKSLDESDKYRYMCTVFWGKCGLVGRGDPAIDKPSSLNLACTRPSKG